MFRKFSFLLLLFSPVAYFSQNTSISGLIIEKETKLPLWGATVGLYNLSDSSLIYGVSTDSVGNFELINNSSNKKYIEINYLGFITKHILISSNSENNQLGIIAIEASNVFLNAIDIVEEKNTLINHLDKKIYNVDKDILSESSSASEILQNIPSVNVDINGAITLRNSGNITFFINGKPSAMLRRNAGAILNQIPASAIEKIEIITNPSAKYRPDGIGGIINIVLKKESKKGVNGQIGGNIGSENRTNGNIILNYNPEDLNIFFDYNIRHSAGTFLYSDERQFKNSSNYLVKNKYTDIGSSSINGLSHSFFTGLTYDLNDNNTIELSGTYFTQSTLHNAIANISFVDSLDAPETVFSNQQTNNEFEGEGEINFSYEHSFKKKEEHTLTFEAAYSSFNEKENLNYNQIYSHPSYFTQQSNNLIQKSGNQQELILDYVLPINEDSEFEAGYAGEFIYENLKYKRTIPTQFKFNQTIHALYALYGQSIENFSFKAGIRTEQTNIKSQLIFPNDTLIPNNYFKVFPTLHLGYEFEKKRELSLSYSKRLNRPDSDELNPNLEYADPRNASSGNANLMPEQIHSIDLGFQAPFKKLTFSNSLFYRYFYDAFTSLQNNIGDSLVIETITNLNTQQALGFESVFSGSIPKKVNLDISGTIYYTSIDATNLGYSSNKSAITGTLKGYSNISLWKNTTIQFNAFYYFPTITPQGKRNQYFYLNGGIKQQLFKNKASLSLTTTDIFNTYKIKHSIETNSLKQTSTIKRKTPVIYIGFVWRFNNYKSKEKLDFEGDGLRK